MKATDGIIETINAMTDGERKALIAQIEKGATEKSTHGGRGRGGGRPRLDGDAQAKRINVSLDQATIDRAREIGDGNLSEGIRRAVSRCAD